MTWTGVEHSHGLHCTCTHLCMYVHTLHAYMHTCDCNLGNNGTRCGVVGMQGWGMVWDTFARLCKTAEEMKNPQMHRGMVK